MNSLEKYYSAKLKSIGAQGSTFNKIKDKDYCGVFLEQGLGKSKVAVDLVMYWLKKKIVSHAIVFTKKGLISNWKEEIRKNSLVNFGILTGNISENSNLFFSNINFLITNFEVLSKEFDRIKELAKHNKVAIILDESAKIKNPDSKLTKQFLEIAPFFSKRCIMTGTPSANRPQDLWSQIYFLDQGESLGSCYKKFKTKVDLSNKLKNNVEAQKRFAENLNKILSHISDFVIRETKKSSNLQLPEKIILFEYADWEDNQKRMYEELREQLKIFIKKKGMNIEENAESVLKRIIRLMQLTSNPGLIDDSYKSEPGKVKKLKEIIEKIIKKEEKCIIWSSYVKNVSWLSNELAKYEPLSLHGKQTNSERDNSIQLFKNEKKYRILVATPQSSKEGLTLTVANHCVFFDRTLSLDDYLQSQDRIHRISQSKTCYIYNLCIKNSIDEWVDKLISAKSLSSKLALGDIDINTFNEQIKYDFGSIIKKILGI